MTTTSTKVQIIIPTYKRATVQQQHMARSVPLSYRENVHLAVRQEQAEDYEPVAEELGVNLLLLPAGSEGIAMARRDIARIARANGWRYGVFDDDMNIRPSKEYGRIPETVSGGGLTDEEFLDCMDRINAQFDRGFVHGGLAAGNQPPDDKLRQHTYNGRIMWCVFYNSTFDPESVDWGLDHILMPEDFFVNLQLLTRGQPNFMDMRYRANPVSTTQAAGGCSEYRTLENSNRGHEILHEAFPEFITLRTKVQKTGNWAGLEKLAVTIYWKKAYASSGKEVVTDETLLTGDGYGYDVPTVSEG